MTKKIVKIQILIVLVISSLLTAGMLKADDVDPSADTTRLLASQCSQCHGTTGIRTKAANPDISLSKASPNCKIIKRF